MGLEPLHAPAAAAALLHYARPPVHSPNTPAPACSTATSWAQALQRSLPPWEAALGRQHDYPEKVTLDASFFDDAKSVAYILPGMALPPPGGPRRAGVVASPARVAARLQATGVLVVLDTALACLQAQLPPPAPERDACNVPPAPHPLECATAELVRRLEDTALPYPVRSSGDQGVSDRTATAAGVQALAACCAVLARLLRLASRRKHSLPAPVPSSDEDSGALLQRGDDPLAAALRPLTAVTIFQIMYDAAAVLSYWRARPGTRMGAWLGAGRARGLAVGGCRHA